MAMKSPWSLMDPATLNSLGNKAMEAGVISPDEAASHLDDAAKMGLMPESKQVSLSMQLPNQGADPYMNVGAADLGAQGKALANAALGDDGNAIRGLKIGRENQVNTQFKRVNNQLNLRNAGDIRASKLMLQGRYPEISDYEQATGEDGLPLWTNSQGQPVAPGTPGAVPVKDKNRPIYNFDNIATDDEDPVQKQERGLDHLEQGLRIQGAANKNFSTTDLTPFAKLADFINQQGGRTTHLADGMAPPEDRSSKLMAYADEIQKRRGDIQKSLSEGTKLVNGGSTLDQLLMASLAKNNLGIDNSKQVQPNQQRKLDEYRFRQSQRLIESQGLQKPLAAAHVANTELQLTNKAIAGAVSKQQLDEMQNIVRQLPAALVAANGGATTGAQRDEMKMGSWEKEYNNLVSTFIKNGVNEIPADDPQLVHFRNLTQHIASRFQNLYEGRLNSITGGMNSMLNRAGNEDLKSDWNNYMMANLELSATGKSALGNLPARTQTAPPVKAASTHRAAPKAQAAAFDASKPLGAGFTPAQKAARLQYLKDKAGQ